MCVSEKCGSCIACQQVVGKNNGQSSSSQGRSVGIWSPEDAASPTRQERLFSKQSRVVVCAQRQAHRAEKRGFCSSQVFLKSPQRYTEDSKSVVGRQSRKNALACCEVCRGVQLFAFWREGEKRI